MSIGLASGKIKPGEVVNALSEAGFEIWLPPERNGGGQEIGGQASVRLTAVQRVAGRWNHNSLKDNVEGKEEGRG